MRKVTDLKKNEVILVQTEEEDLAIRTLMHDAGLRWCNGDSYFERSGFPLGGGKYYNLNEGAWGDIETAKKAGYTIYPASDFLEPNLESLTEQLKKLAESKGMKAEIVFKEKDIWEEAEFCKHVSGTHYKIDRIENQYIFTSGGSILIDANCEPVSEEVYVNWLKSEVVRRFGDIKVGDKFIEHQGDEWAMRTNFTMNNEEWVYGKGLDRLWYYSLMVYRKGKWAERVDEKENIKVKWISSCVDSVSLYFKFEVDGDHGLQYGNKAGEHLAKKLQKYLNRKK